VCHKVTTGISTLNVFVYRVVGRQEVDFVFVFLGRYCIIVDLWKVLELNADQQISMIKNFSSIFFAVSVLSVFLFERGTDREVGLPTSSNSRTLIAEKLVKKQSTKMYH
jgi:hypothetical protein